MLGEFVTRLAIALPLVCALAAFSLWALKRGRIALPATMTRGGPQTEAGLDVLAVRALSPAARLAVVRFDGRTHLLGVAGDRISLLLAATGAAEPPEGEDAP